MTLKITEVDKIMSQHAIGEYFQNGIIFYSYQNPQTQLVEYLILHTEDLDLDHVWSNLSLSAGAVSNWNGSNNTSLILNQENHVDSSAKLCRDLGPEWYLPSINELEALWNNLYNVNMTLSYLTLPEILSNTYWSSTEFNDSTAYCISLETGEISKTEKYTEFSVRPIRKVVLEY